MKNEKYKRITILIMAVSIIFTSSIMYTVSKVKVERQDKIKIEKIAKVSVDLNKKKENQRYITKEQKETNMYIYYPYSDSKEFNKNINDILDKYKDIIKSSREKNWNLEIIYNVDEYDEKIKSFVFNIKINDGGNYPITHIETITFDFEKNKILNLKDILKDYNSQIYDISNICYNELIQNENVKSFGNIDKVKDGTKYYKLNKYSLEKNVLIIFFERYAVAPYVVGELNVCIPLNEIEIQDL